MRDSQSPCSHTNTANTIVVAVVVVVGDNEPSAGQSDAEGKSSPLPLFRLRPFCRLYPSSVLFGFVALFHFVILLFFGRFYFYTSGVGSYSRRAKLTCLSSGGGFVDTVIEIFQNLGSLTTFILSKVGGAYTTFWIQIVTLDDAV